MGFQEKHPLKKLHRFTSVSSVQSLSCVQLFATPWTGQHARPPLSVTNSQSLLKLMSTESVMPSNHPIFCHQFSSWLQSLPGSGSFQMSKYFASGSQNAELQLQHQSFQWIFRTDILQDGWVGSPCSPRDSQESSPTPQFKSINSLALQDAKILRGYLNHASLSQILRAITHHPAFMM